MLSWELSVLCLQVVVSVPKKLKTHCERLYVHAVSFSAQSFCLSLQLVRVFSKTGSFSVFLQGLFSKSKVEYCCACSFPVWNNIQDSSLQSKESNEFSRAAVTTAFFSPLPSSFSLCLRLPVVLENTPVTWPQDPGSCGPIPLPPPSPTHPHTPPPRPPPTTTANSLTCCRGSCAEPELEVGQLNVSACFPWVVFCLSSHPPTHTRSWDLYSQALSLPPSLWSADLPFPSRAVLLGRFGFRVKQGHNL